MLSALLAGCGGSSAEAAAADRSSCPPSPGVAADEVRIGLLYPDTGPEAEMFGVFRSGVDARLGAANAQGGVHGRTVTYDWRDSQSAAQATLAGARELVEQSGVFAVVGASGHAPEAMRYLGEQGVPFVGQDLTVEGAHVFGYTNAAAAEAGNTLYPDFARSHGATRAVVLRTALIPRSHAVAEQLSRSLEAGGVEVVGMIDWTPGMVDPARVGQQIRNLGADMVTGAIPARPFAEIVAAARDAGGQIELALLPNGYDPGILDGDSEVMAGMYFFVEFVPFEAARPAHEHYLTAMARYAPQAHRPDQAMGLVGWMTADLFLRGLQEAGDCPTRAGYIEALRAVQDFDAGGLLQRPVAVAAKNPPEGCVTVVQVNDTATAFTIQEPNPLCGKAVQ